MTTEVLLHDLRQRGVIFSIEDDMIYYGAPHGVLQAEDFTHIQRLKQELICLISHGPLDLCPQHAKEYFMATTPLLDHGLSSSLTKHSITSSLLRPEIITVTPKQAQMWLNNALPNRSIMKTKVAAYFADMASGKWGLTGQPLLFDEAGRLMDGQHRLQACVQANVNFMTLAVFGVSHAFMHLIDIGKVRSPGDAVSITRGIQSSKVVAAAIKWLWHYETHTITGYQYDLPRYLLLEMCDNYPNIQKSLWVKPLMVNLLPGSIAVALHYLMQQKQQKDGPQADTYFEALGRGVGLSQHDLVYKLREQLQKNAVSRAKKMTHPLQAALVIKAWNSWQSGKKQGNSVRWIPDGEKPEPFPTIL